MYGWEFAPSVAGRNWIITKFKAPVRASTFPKCSDDKLLEKGCPEKICAIKKGTLSYLLPTDILNVMYMWIIGIEYHDKLKALVMQINNQLNTVLRVPTYHNWVCIMKFGNMLGFKMIR